jgi:hypothetical protein
MLDDRGYIIPKEELEFTLDSFKTKFGYTGEYSHDNPPKYVEK